MFLQMQCLEYGDLITRAKNNYIAEIQGGKNFSLRWCDECDEINLWTYWQGVDNLSAEVVVIGQDFGCPFDEYGNLKDVYKDIVADKSEASMKYIQSVKKPGLGNDFETDVTLQELLKSVSEDLDPFIPNNNKLFFTNVCLGYRKQGSSNGGIYADPMKKDATITVDLIKKLNPKIVICLGLSTFNAVVSAAGGKRVSGLNKLLDNGGCFQQLLGTNIICQAHPGAIGKMNRKKYTSQKVSSVDKILMEDWKIIKKFI